MKPLILAVILAVGQAGTPVPRKAPNTATSGGSSVKQNSQDKQSPSPSPPIQEAPTTESRQNTGNQPSYADTEKAIVIRKPVTVTVKGDWWNYTYVILNGCLVLIAAFGVCVAIGSLKAIERQAKSLKEEIRLTHRPRLIVRNIVIAGLENLNRKTSMNKWSQKLTGYYTVANVGGLPATIQWIGEGAWVEKVLPMKRPDQEQPGRNVTVQLEPGESKQLNFGEIVFDVEDACDLIDGKSRAFFLARIRYRDLAGISRETGVCRVFDGTLQYFVRTDNTDYEYSD
jgi:hypothetical protein